MVVLRIRQWLAVLLFMGMVGAGLPVYAAPSLSSLSAVVYQPDSELILFEKDADIPRPMASTTKLMTALLAAQYLDPDSTVRVPAAALPVEGSQIGLKVGDVVTVRDLLVGLLLASGNDTANVLALLMADSLPAFAAMMNEKAAALGMVNSHFVTPSGLDGEGHAASARDMALLGAAVLEQPLLAQLCATKSTRITVSGICYTVKNHNKLLSLYDDCIGLKTGFTKKSGRCLVSAAQRDGVTLVVVTLHGGDYWNDHMALYEYAFPLVERVTVPSAPLATCAVIGGMVNTVSLVAEELPTCVRRVGEEIACSVEKPPYLWAPIAADQVVGQVVYTIDERTVATVSLYATDEVAARPVPGWVALWWRRFLQLAEGLLV